MGIKVRQGVCALPRHHMHPWHIKNNGAGNSESEQREGERQRETEGDRETERDREGGRGAGILPFDSQGRMEVVPCSWSLRLRGAGGLHPKTQ